MFNNLGWPELLMLLLFGLIIFGPDQLPKIAGDLGRMIRQLRKLATDASADLRSELGPEFDDVDLASLNPRRFIEKHLLADDDDGPPNASPGTTAPVAPEAAEPVAATTSAADPAVDQVEVTAEATPAPYDADAT